MQGGGTPGNPYVISSVESLNIVRNCISASYILTQDIDLNVAPYNQGAGWTRIGTSDAPFTGTFDGNGHVIKDLYINRSDPNHQTDCEQGLFGFIGDGGTVKNLRVENASVSAGRHTGILAGMINGSGTIENCSTSGTVNGTGRIGGMVGSIQANGAVVSKSFSTAAVISSGTEENGDAGGLAGTIINGTVQDCYATGSVSGVAPGGSFGGMVGYFENGTVMTSYAIGQVTGSTNPGGLIGYKSNGSVTDCFYDTQSTGRSTSAGGTGLTTTLMKQQSSFTSWDFTSVWGIQAGVTYPNLQWAIAPIDTAAIAGVTVPVTGATPVSTIAATSEYTATISWSPTGATFASSTAYTATITITPTAGYTLTGVAANFFTVTGATTVTNSAGSGVVTAVFPATAAAPIDTAVSNPSNTGFTVTLNPALTGLAANDFTLKDSSNRTVTITGATTSDGGATYAISAALSAGQTYTVTATKIGYDFGTAQSVVIPVQGISSVANLDSIRNSPSGSYILTQDIDLAGTSYNDNSGTGWIPIGTGNAPFTGTLDGNGHVIRNLYINRHDSNHVTDSEQGLFGFIGAGGTVINLSVENASISAGRNTGILAGMINGSGTIENCSTSGTVNGTGRVGGLVGSIQGAGAKVTRSFSTAAVTANGTECNGDAGGLAGTIFYGGTVQDCYATGSVSGATSQGSFGGLVGYLDNGTVMTSYAIGAVSSGNTYLGGLIGARNSGSSSVTNCFYDTQSTGRSTSAGGTGLTTTLMKQQSSFTSWDFTSVWGIQADQSYPYLQWQPVPITLTVSSLSNIGFTVTLHPALAGLTTSNFTLLDGLNHPVNITETTTVDNGATYVISAALSAGQTYTVTATTAGYSGTTQMAIEVLTVSNPATTGFTVALSPALSGLIASNFTLLDISSIPVNITGATTPDNGATYVISAALIAGQTYAVTATDAGYTFGTAQSGVIPQSSDTTVTSSVYMVGLNTITNVPLGTAKAAFLASLSKSESHQTWDTIGVNDPVVYGNTIVVTAQDGTTQKTYTIIENVYANNTHVVISQVYGGGGVTNPTYKNDFIELYNPTNQPVSLVGWSVKYASALGTSWSSTNLNGVIQPNSYYLIKENGGTSGLDLPIANMSGTISMGATNGKVALVNNTPSGANVIDFVGYGSANEYEGSAAVLALSATTSAWRDSSDGVWDTDDNSADFIVLTPNPRNSSTAATITTQPSNVTETIGNTATFTVIAAVSDGGALTYKWQKSADGSMWNDITGAINASYTTGTLVIGDNGSHYRCVVTNTNNGTTATVTSSIATLTLDTAACLARYQGAQKRYHADSNTYDIRFLATIDTLDASSVGFVFSKSQTNPTKDSVPSSQVKSTTTVYDSVTAAGSTVTATDLGGTYIIACTVTGIPAADFNTPLYVRAFSTIGTETTYTSVQTVTVSSLH